MRFNFVQPVYAQCDPGAQGGINLGDCLTLKDGQTVSSVYDTPATLVNLVVRNLFTLGGIFLFLMVFYSGYKFISGGTKGKDEAKGVITTAFTGMIVMFAAYWIVQIVELIVGSEII